MSRINYVIPSQSWEIVRDRIAEIIADELENQVALSYDTEIDAQIFIERSIPVDKTECPLINVSLSNGSYSNKTNGASVTGTYVFDIDCYKNAKTSADQNGDEKASLIMQKILGKVRAILENPIYKCLGYQPGFISRTGCSDLNIAIPGAGKLDTENTIMGRLSFSVTLTEITELLIPRLIAGYDTQLKLEATNVGFKYTGNTV